MGATPGAHTNRTHSVSAVQHGVHHGTRHVPEQEKKVRNTTLYDAKVLCLMVRACCWLCQGIYITFPGDADYKASEYDRCACSMAEGKVIGAL